jgi:hypothetical protein
LIILLAKWVYILVGNKRKERKNNGHMLGTKIEDGFWRKRLLGVCLEEDLNP